MSAGYWSWAGVEVDPQTGESAAAPVREVETTVASPCPVEGARRLSSRPLTAVEARRVRWLVPGLFPLDMLTLIAGVGGLGKSTYVLGVAARTSTGELLGEPADVTLISFEDTAAEVLRPRVKAAGGDLDRVHEVYVPLEDGGAVALPLDLDRLALEVERTRSRLVIIDPIVAALELQLDAHKDQHVRVVLAQLAQLAEERACAVVIVAHLNKAPSRDAYLRIGGSVAFYNACRSVVLVTADPAEPEQQRLVTQAKANLARLRPVQRHLLEEIVLMDELDPDDGQPIVTSRMRYLEDADEVDRNDVLADVRHSGDGKQAEAELFLLDALSDGTWHESEGLKTLARAHAQVSPATLKRAALDLDVEYERRGFPSTTWWRLPQSDHVQSDHASSTTREPTGQTRMDTGFEADPEHSRLTILGEGPTGPTVREWLASDGVWRRYDTDPPAFVSEVLEVRGGDRNGGGL